MKSLILSYRLWRMRRETAPSKAFVARLGQRLASMAPKLSWYATPVFRRSFVTFCTIMSLGVSTTSYAYAADDVLPGDVLYPVKQSVETVELSLAKEEQKKAVIERQVARRKQEIHRAAVRLSEHPIIKENRLKQIEQTTVSHINAFKVLTPEEKDVLRKSVHESVRKELGRERPAKEPSQVHERD
ncbi:MAG: DUF5667 domain-containing protein [Patescibacteria group bacterium]